MPKLNPELIVARMREAAQGAADETYARLVPINAWYPCGFATIHISPARGPLVTYFKKNGMGHKSYYGGYDVSWWEFASVSGPWVQSMTIGESAASAAASVAREYGIECYTQSRMD